MSTDAMLRWKAYGAELADAGIVVHAPDTTLLWANDKASKMLGISRDELTGKLAADPDFRLIDADGSELPLARYPVVMALSTRARVADYIVGTKLPSADQPTWGQISAEPILEDGELAAVVVTFVDITALREAQAERERAQAQLEAAARLESVAVLAGGVAHDFNNLLVGILSAADMARSVLDSKSELAEALELILQGGRRAAELTQQLMAYAGRAPRVVEVVDVRELVEELARLVRGALPEDAVLDLRLDPYTPTVEVDATQLRQVVLNLLVNAAEAMRGREGQVRVRTGRVRRSAAELERGGYGEPGDYAAIFVDDDGNGMDAPTLARIFEPFFTTKESGHGLGLAAVHGMVRTHRGYVWVDSVKGKGTRFELGIPASDKVARRADGSRSTTARVGTGRHALIVDDEPMVRRVLARLLMLEGFSVSELSDGSALSSTLEAGVPDVVVLDVSLPGVSGTALLTQLRRRHPALRIVLSSGHLDLSDRLTLDPNEPTVFLPKPYVRAQLESALRRLFQLPPSG